MSQIEEEVQLNLVQRSDEFEFHESPVLSAIFLKNNESEKSGSLSQSDWLTQIFLCFQYFKYFVSLF